MGLWHTLEENNIVGICMFEYLHNKEFPYVLQVSVSVNIYCYEEITIRRVVTLGANYIPLSRLRVYICL